MEEMLVKVEEKGLYQNPKLNQATRIINTIGDNIRKEAYKVAAVLAAVEKNKTYELDGFESLQDWTKDAFGWAKTQTYNLLKIGQEYTAIEVDKNGKVKSYTCDLNPAFTTSQVVRLLPLGHAEALKAVEEGTISPAMTVKEITAKVKEIRGKAEKEAAEDEAPEAEEEEAPEAPEKETEILIRVMDTHGKAYEVPAEILAKYKVTD